MHRKFKKCYELNSKKLESKGKESQKKPARNKSIFLTESTRVVEAFSPGARLGVRICWPSSFWMLKQSSCQSQTVPGGATV